MYLDFYGLSEPPFELTANPRYLFLTGTQREALSILQYGLMSVKSLTLLIGDAGTGKTTLIQAALASERCRNIRCVYLNNPMLSQADFVSLLAHRFDLGSDAASSKSVLLDRLETTLRERHANGETTALIVDEAQSLSTELLEEIRLLANMETPTEKLLPLLLAGQPELADRLEQPNLRQLKQRVAIRCELVPFELGDTAAYIASRVRTAGGVPAGMFTQEAVTVIHKFARGIPRIINVICDNALVSGMALGHPRIERAHVVEVCRDLHLSLPSLHGLDDGGMRTADVASPSHVDAAQSEQAADEVGIDTGGDGGGSSSRFRFGFRWRNSPSARTSARIVNE
jgi:general secretion pathway protein A